MKLWSPGTLAETGDMIRLASTDAFTRTAVDDDIIIEGWATTEALNSYKQIVLAKSFKWDDGLALFNGRILAFHDQRKEPVGICEQMKIIPGEGLWMRVRVFRESAPLFKRSIAEGVLNAFSIGFQVEEYIYDEKTEVMTFTRCKLLEVSIVNVGANEEALFKIVHSLVAQLPDYDENKEHDSVPYVVTWVNANERKKAMPDKIVVNPEYLAADRYETEKQEITKNVDELKRLQATMHEALKSAQTNMITKAELMQQLSRMNDDLTEIQSKVEKGLMAQRRDADLIEHFTFNDHHSLLELGKFDWLKTHDGLPFNEMQYRAYRLFNMPVDYAKHARGQELINVRNLHDAVYCVDRWRTFNSHSAAGGGRYQLENQPIWKQFIAAVKPFDEALAHAMAGGNSGYGAEWVPTEFSAEFNDYMRIQPNLPNYFKFWTMPPSGSGYFPFQNGVATVYKGGESLVDNATQARKTNIATGQKLFTPALFIGALVSSENLMEDSIIDMVTMIRQELTTAILEGLENAIINGDTTATHMDDDPTSTYTPSYSVRKCFKGLRRIAVDDSNTYDVETPSADTGLDALTIGGIRYGLNKLGVFATADKANCIRVTGMNGKEQIEQALLKEDASGILPYLLSGDLPPIAGVKTYISGQYEEAQDSDGFYHDGSAAATSYHTSILTVHTPSFRIAQRRGITLEMSKDILTQQQQFVASARFDFGKVCASALNPVSAGINVQWGA